MVVESTIETLELSPSKLTLISSNLPSTRTSISRKIYPAKEKNACTIIPFDHALSLIKNCKTLYFVILVKRRSLNLKVNIPSIKKDSI